MLRSLIATAVLTTSTAFAADPSPQTFVNGLSQKVLVGSYTVDAQRPDGVPMKTDQYRIGGVRHVEGDQYIVESQITYGTNDVTVPVPVTVQYAGETPVLSLDNLTIPLLGEDFGAKILFDFEAGRYAGTWRHGDVGGSMWGRITDPPKEPGGAETPDVEIVPGDAEPVDKSPTRDVRPVER